MYDPSTSKRGAPPTYYIRPVFVAFWTLCCVLLSTYSAVVFTEAPWFAMLIGSIVKLFSFGMVACMRWLLPKDLSAVTVLRMAFFSHILVVNLLLIHYWDPAATLALKAWAATLVCDITAFNITSRCGRLFVVEGHEESWPVEVLESGVGLE
ncbi:hypothetical protein MKEN_00652600 [Mycena kentingensis (nom. inval.)]|nr:hypothetical protein MKEN_00652600 [Mycena kentingensis (nom. inval.)]